MQASDVCVVCCVFVFKQKTAYEMRISDWSSDVCSSDLISPAILAGGFGDGIEPILHKVHDKARVVAIAPFPEKVGSEGAACGGVSFLANDPEMLVGVGNLFLCEHRADLVRIVAGALENL